jgi:hypothetical protein
MKRKYLFETSYLLVGLWRVMPLSTIFQLYRGGQFYWLCLKSQHFKGIYVINAILPVYNVKTIDTFQTELK